MAALESVVWERFLPLLRVQNVDQVTHQICVQHGIDASSSSQRVVRNVLTAFLSAKVQAVGRSTCPAPPPPQAAAAATASHAKPTQKEQTLDEAQSLQELAGTPIEQVIQHAIRHRILGQDLACNAIADFFDFDRFTQRLESLRKAFPEHLCLHALALKANPLRGLLREAVARGFGAECASFEEVQHALALGFAPRRIIFDSPCKTLDELQQLVLAGVYINLDNEDEVLKMQRILLDTHTDLAAMDRQVGLRINPMVGGGAIAAVSTATATSKFGLPLNEETFDRILAIYEENPWLQGVHVHVGSQTCNLSLLAAGVKRAYEFAVQTNQRLGKQQIRVIDIGGGMPTSYDSIHEAHGFEQYAEELRRTVPQLFDGEFQVITEFGRSVFVKSGFTVSRVEAVKNWLDQRIAVIHIGANQFFRMAYYPWLWPHIVTVFSDQGKLKARSSPFVKQDLAGPLCFASDFVARQRLLPLMATGDFVAIHDSGGYTLSFYNKFCSRSSSPVYAYRQTPDGAVEFAKLRNRESVDETLAFWGIDTSAF